MSDDSVKVEFSGLVTVQNCLSQNNVETTQQELVSLFDDFDSDEISVNDYAQKITEKYGLESRDIVLDAISQIASNEGDNSVISKYDIELQRDKEFDTLLANMPELQESFQIILNNIVSNYGVSLQTTVENNGKIAHLWDSFKNATGMGLGSDKAQAELDKAKALLEELKNDPAKLKEIYKEITGNELNGEEFEKLSNNEADFKNSPIIKSVSKYIQGQKQTTNTVSTIASAATVAGLIASGIFTGGLSWLAAGAICVGAGTASYMIPQVIDGTTEKDGYSKTEVAQDVLIGGFNSLINTATLGSAATIGKVISSKVANQAIARFLTAEVVANSLGDTIAVGDYALEALATRLDDWTISEEDVALFEKLANGELKEGDEGYIEALQKYQEIYGNNSEFSLKGLAITGGTAVVASTAAGGSAFVAQGTVGNIISQATQNSSGATQILSRLFSGGLTGAAAGQSAAITGGGAAYLLTTDGKDINFKDWLNASVENAPTGAITGMFSGLTFEAINIVAGTPAPFGTKANKGVTEDGLRYTDYVDEKGTLIARDVSAKDLQSFLNSRNSQQGLVEYNSNNPKEIPFQQGARTVRFNFTNTQIEQMNWWGNTLNPYNAQTTPKTPQTVTEQNKIENPKAIITQNKGLALNSENPTIESVVGFNSGMLSGIMAPVNAPLNSQNANENSGSIPSEIVPVENSTPVQFSIGKEEALEATQTPQKPQKIKINIPKGSELDLQLSDLANQAAQQLASDDLTVGTLDEALLALGISRGEILKDNNSYKATIDLGEISARSKGADSIYSKIIKLISEGKKPVAQTPQDVINMIGDAQGLRLTLKNLTENLSDHPLSKAEIDALQNEQNKAFVDSLIKAIKEDKLHVYEIENYCAEDGIPYLTKKNLDDLNDAYEEWFKAKLKAVENKECDDFEIYRDDNVHLKEVKTGRLYGSRMNVCETKNRNNGYTGTNISLVDSKGQNVEFQLRGPEVNEIAHPEHIIYDIKQGKETVAGEEYSEIRKVISKIFTIKDKDADGYNKYENPELAQAYDRYFADIYNASREIELGKRAKGDLPNINDYEVLVRELTEEERYTVSIEGVKEFCKKIEEAKLNLHKH